MSVIEAVVLPLALLLAVATPALVFVFVFPRLPGFKLKGNPWLTAVLFAVAECFCFGCAFGFAASASLIMGFWAAMGGGGGAVPVILAITFGIAAVFVYMVITALIAASQGLNAVLVEKKSMPFIGALVLLVIHGAVVFGCGLSALIVTSGGRAGYIDKTGKFVIEPKFHSAYRFINGVARVEPDNAGSSTGYAYIDRTGKIVTPDDLTPFEHREPELKLDEPPEIYEDSGSNSAGRYLITHGDLEMLPFSEGLALAKKKNTIDEWGFVDKSFNFVIPPGIFTDARHFTEGLAPAEGLVVRDGKTLSQGDVGYDPHWGFVDKAGKWVIQPQFESAECFSEGLACVQTSGKEHKYGFIDKTGKFVIPPRYSFASSFAEGLAPVDK